MDENISGKQMQEMCDKMTNVERDLRAFWYRSVTL